MNDSSNQLTFYFRALPLITRYRRAFTVGSQQLTRTSVLEKIGGPSSDPPIFSTGHATIAYSGLSGLTVTGGQLRGFYLRRGKHRRRDAWVIIIQHGCRHQLRQRDPDRRKRLEDLGSDVTINAPLSSKGTTVTIDNSNRGEPAPRAHDALPQATNMLIGPTSTTFGDPITVNYSNVHMRSRSSAAAPAPTSFKAFPPARRTPSTPWGRPEPLF